ncbi:hypothetical protein K0I73_01750 [Shewanella mesophila]|uniref:hypothetical protein n=1 Tax=Shewanella mesophila TaxID=2864208 RepID=UPI001C6567D5|nr:hypothetical protein [Shewanella mesophila]QYJ86506.1 hypothetical protein K0I73_01750 [Shewanella mesophila]
MQIQQQADSELIQVYGKIVAIAVMLLILAVLGFRFVGSVDKVSAQGLKIEHARLLNVLAMVRSQWMSQGRPTQMMLDWSTALDRGGGEQNIILMSNQGWPTLDKISENSCNQLWWQLLGSKNNLAQVTTSRGIDGDICSFIASNGDRLSYQLSTGRVIFLTDH